MICRSRIGKTLYILGCLRYVKMTEKSSVQGNVVEVCPICLVGLAPVLKNPRSVPIKRNSEESPGHDGECESEDEDQKNEGENAKNEEEKEVQVEGIEVSQ